MASDLPYKHKSGFDFLIYFSAKMQISVSIPLQWSRLGAVRASIFHYLLFFDIRFILAGDFTGCFITMGLLRALKDLHVCSLWRWERNRGTEYACISAYSKSVCVVHGGQNKVTPWFSICCFKWMLLFLHFSKESGQYVLIWYVIFAQRQFVQDIPPG